MGFLERDMKDAPSIPEFYKGKTILITGGSGFMGKVLIEKLLYSCSDLERIYLLMREKKGVKSEHRLQELYASQCFDRLRAEKPNIFRSKVFVIAGDVMELNLGLNEEDRALIVNRTNIIFHVAASVRFDDPLSLAAKLNLRGTREVVKLAQDIKDLKVLAHISTSYSNTNRNPVEEVMYPAHANWRDVLDVVDTVDEHTLRTMTPKYLGSIPNTYTFTKQLAEHAVYEQRGRLPALIIRPSIVISSIKEPIPGWIENFNGPVGILVACGKGIMRSIYSDPDIISDYIPVDVAIQNFIAAAWIRGTKKLETTDDIPIYNCCAGNLNHIKMGELVNIGKQLASDMPLNDVLWSVGGDVTTSKTIHYVKVMLLHILPAIFIDALLWILGKKPMLVKVQRRIYIANLALQYYITQQWTFSNENFVALRQCILKQDYNDFYYDVEGVDVYEYFKKSVEGGRRYLLKEKDEDLPKARAHYARILVLEKLTKCIVYGYLFWWVVNSQWFHSLVNILKELFIL